MNKRLTHPEDREIARLGVDVAQLAAATSNPSLAIALIIVEAQQHVSELHADAEMQTQFIRQQAR